MRIYLIGYSYSGKTTMGRGLAERLGFRFFDTDKALEIKYRTTIPLFFERYGEQAFRIVERQILYSTTELDNVVVSTGGGTACNDDNIAFMLRNGIVVYLQMDVESIMGRLTVSHKKRPILRGKTTAELREYILKHLEARLPYYSQAHITADAKTATPEEIANLLSVDRP